MTEPAGSARRVAVITGGASGFGLALGHCCAADGMDVVLLDLDADRVKDEAAALPIAHGAEAIGLRVDVSQSEHLTAAASAVSERFGRADLVVSNVGVQLLGAVEEFTDDEWRWVLDVNLLGAVRTARAFLPLLRQTTAARLAFTTSSSVLAPGSRMAAYQASKFAVWGLAETLRLELANDDVAVSVVFPSGMISRHLETSAAAQPEDLRRPVGAQEDFEAMRASNPGLARDVTTPQNAARRAFDGLMAGESYVVTHGDVVDAVATRFSALSRAATTARDAALSH